jgi:hypothetical protein
MVACRMRKRTIRNGLRLVLAALSLIIFVSFYLGNLGDLLAFNHETESRIYQSGIFLAAVMGGYGVVSAAFGFVLTADKRDSAIRVLPVFMMIMATVSLFFYLLAASFDAPHKPRLERLRPGETITI